MKTISLDTVSTDSLLFPVIFKIQAKYEFSKGAKSFIDFIKSVETGVWYWIPDFEFYDKLYERAIKNVRIN